MGDFVVDETFPHKILAYDERGDLVGGVRQINLNTMTAEQEGSREPVKLRKVEILQVEIAKREDFDRLSGLVKE